MPLLVVVAPPPIAPLSRRLARAEGAPAGALLPALAAVGADLAGGTGRRRGAPPAAPLEAIAIVIIGAVIVVKVEEGAPGLLTPALVALLTKLADAPGVAPVASVRLPNSLADAVPAAVVAAAVAGAVGVAATALALAVATPVKQETAAQIAWCQSEVQESFSLTCRFYRTRICPCWSTYLSCCRTCPSRIGRRICRPPSRIDPGCRSRPSGSPYKGGSE